jgi:outer membrane receptor protein involved in Fe transport
MKNYLLIIICVLCSCLAMANGIVKGKVTNDALQPLANATLKITTLDTVIKTDAQGNFELSLPVGIYEIEFDAKGYLKKAVSDIAVIEGNITSIDVTLKPNKKNSINGITVKSTFKKENINALISKQKNSATIMDAISAEAIKQVPAKSAADVVKRVSGITIVDNKYIVIRGLSDRYNAAYLNGSPLPSTDPDKKAFSFDIFPSNVLENIVVVKAATPDMPAEFAGGQIFLNSKDAQKNNSLQIQLGIGANSQATGKQYIKTPNGSTDWLGFDDGTRKLPSGIPQNLKAYNALSDAQATALTKNFTYNWGNTIGNSLMPNKNLQISGNTKWDINKNISIGALLAVSYNRSFKKEIAERNDKETDGTTSFNFKDTLHKDNVLAGAMLNLGVSIGNNHKVYLKNFVNQNTDRIDLNRSGIIPANDFMIRSFTNSYLTNTLASSQLIGEHVWKLKDIKLEWETGINTINRATPDLRNVLYTHSITDPDDSVYKVAMNTFPNMQTAGRFYSNLIEHVYNSKVDVQFPFTIQNVKSKVKTGIYIQNRDRQFTARRFGYVLDNGISNIISLQPGDLFSANHIGENGLRIEEATQPSDAYSAGSNNNAIYAMLENVIAKKVKVVYGLRYENFSLRLNSSDGLNNKTYTRNYNNVLPSAVATYLLNDKTNIRLSASQTLSRPEFREIAPFAFFDFVNNVVLQGFDSLQQAKITNLDARYEIYPNKGEMISASAFYKHFNNPIEQRFFSTGAGSQTRTFINSDVANLYGVEAECRKSLGFITPQNDSSIFNDISVFGNTAYMISKVDYTYNNVKYTRPMQGQSNYIINLGISYVSKKYDGTASIVYNRIGQRIIMVGDNSEPNVWEKPRDLLDLQVSKTFAKKVEVRFTISDIFNQYFMLYQNQVGSEESKYNSKSDIFVKSKQGTNYGLSVAYKWK